MHDINLYNIILAQNFKNIAMRTHTEHKSPSILNRVSRPDFHSRPTHIIRRYTHAWLRNILIVHNKHVHTHKHMHIHIYIHITYIYIYI